MNTVNSLENVFSKRPTVNATSVVHVLPCAGLLDQLASFWTKVASEFSSSPYILGYELINEPWAGEFSFKHCCCIARQVCAFQSGAKLCKCHFCLTVIGNIYANPELLIPQQADKINLQRIYDIVSL